jgi:hypothetical protein
MQSALAVPSARGLQSRTASVSQFQHGAEVATASEKLGRIAMRSRSFHTDIESYENDVEALVEATAEDRKHYGRGRSARTAQRRTSRPTPAKVPLGMAGRRNRRWAW